MLRNYLKIAWRNLFRNKGYTAINIIGLAVGVCCFVLIALFVKNEWSYDQFHTKADRIYRVWQHENYGPREDFVNTTTPVSMATVLKQNIPEIENTCRVYRLNGLVKQNEMEFNEAVHVVDTTFFQLFDFDILQGNSSSPLSAANGIVLSQSAAKKYFGNEDAVGKTMGLELNGDFRSFEVMAVTTDPPQESSIQYSLLISLENEALFFNERQRRSWFNVVLESYVLLRPEIQPASLETKFPAIIEQYLGDNFEEDTFFLHLQPLTEIHLDTSLPAGLEPISSPKYSYVLASIGFLVLLLACINFVTLAVGRSFSRATEVGVRKALGAYRQQIIHQFWGEAMLITLMAVALGMGMAHLFLDGFNSLTGKMLGLTFDFFLVFITLALIVFIALLAGFYPSFVLSKFNPVSVLKGKSIRGVSMGLFGKSLVVLQFVASIILLVATLVIGRQIDFLVNKDLGYQKDAIIVVPTNMQGEEANSFTDLYVSNLKKEARVEEASSSLFSFAENSWFQVGFTDVTNTYREFAFNEVDPGFLKTHAIPLAAGRDFREGSLSDAQSGVLVNEAFVLAFGLQNPVGAPFDKFEVQILGVMKDFHFESLNNSIGPLMLAMNPEPVLSLVENIESQNVAQPRVSVRLNSENLSSGIPLLKQAWEDINPSQEFEYVFLDESLAAQYQNELRSRTIVNIASILSLFIACMGLFGLATLSVARRTAEIGIRKVMGATEINIVAMISRDFVRLVCIAMALAFPLAWWAIREWLRDFAYTVDVNGWYFLASGSIVLVITIFTVSFQSVKASLANPVESLRTE